MLLSDSVADEAGQHRLDNRRAGPGHQLHGLATVASNSRAISYAPARLLYYRQSEFNRGQQRLPPAQGLCCSDKATAGQLRNSVVTDLHRARANRAPANTSRASGRTASTLTLQAADPFSRPTPTARLTGHLWATPHRRASSPSGRQADPECGPADSGGDSWTVLTASIHDPPSNKTPMKTSASTFDAASDDLNVFGHRTAASSGRSFSIDTTQRPVQVRP